MRKERTVAAPVATTGVGIHGGTDVRVEIEPAPPGSGIVFRRSDLPGCPEIPARSSQALRWDRQTVLGRDDVEVQTVEHFLSAAHALGIDNLLCILDGPEMPAAGGSARSWVELLESAGLVEQDRPRRRLRLERQVEIRDGDSEIVAVPNGQGLAVSYTLDYPLDVPMPSQHVAFDIDAETFKAEIAPARTFCLESEARALRAAGFGKGADTKNTLVVGEEGVIDNELLFPDEFARHKVLDLVGDLALLGADLEARVIATRSGHRTNLKLVEELTRILEETAMNDEHEGAEVMGVQEILDVIPHRYPFLFLDRVIELDGYDRAVGIKNVTANEPQFQGHWPGNPIFPGVLQIEALAQLAGVMFMRHGECQGKIAVLMSVDDIKFRRPVVPGDQLRLECETVSFKPTAGKVIGKGTVDGKVTVQAVLKFRMTNG